MSINVFLIQQIFFSEKWQGASVASYRVRVSQVTYSFKTRKDVEQGTRSGNTDSCRNRLSLFLLRHTLLSCAQQHPSLFVVSTRIDKHAQLFMTNIRFVFIGVSVCVCGSQLVLESLITVSFRRLFACSLLIDFSYQKKDRLRGAPKVTEPSRGWCLSYVMSRQKGNRRQFLFWLPISWWATLAPSPC